uniref:glutamine-hydrolyzing carbamoyl-phosphate synthase small subunit n=1 Tax=Buchnera aphidicola TaxID=9 RepID=UPI003F5CC75D
MENTLDKSGILILEDGNIFKGDSIGENGYAIGEVVFNTSMTGYQEIITDPSYSEQIITFTYPHIGNVGINTEDYESEKIYIKGIIIRNLSLIASNYKSKQNFDSYLKKNKIIAITNIDTRKLTHILRNKGSQNGYIQTYSKQQKINDNAYEKLKMYTKTRINDLAKQVSTKNIYTLIKTKNDIIKINLIPSNIKKKYLHIVVYDFGVKKNIINMLLNRNCYLTIVPANTTFEKVIKLIPDGIFFSNGPGDPRICNYAIRNIKKFFKINIPMFGICLGHQLLALANGANIIKMKFGHHGSNHPVKEIDTNRVMITTQNHGFTIDHINLPKTIKITHISLFDNSIQGISWIDKPIFGFQGHPESSPGPHDTSYLFDNFIKSILTIK